MQKINTLQELMIAAKCKRSVTIKRYYDRPVPAAWIINTIGVMLLAYFESGMFLYEPAPKLPKFSDRKKTEPQQTKMPETKLLENKL